MFLTKSEKKTCLWMTCLQTAKTRNRKIGSIRRSRFFLLLFFLGLLLGCAAQMHTLQMADIRESLNEGVQKADWLEKKIYRDNGDFKHDAGLVHLLELGALYPLLGEFDKSNEVLEFAFQKYTAREERAKINARDTATDAIDILLGEGADEYEMAQFEKVYIHNIKAMNYLMMGKPNAARVETQRAINRHRLIREYAAFEAAQTKEGKAEVKNKLEGTLTNQPSAWRTYKEFDFDASIKALTQKASLPDNQKREIRHVRNAYENCYTYLLSALTFGLNREFENIRPQLKNATALTGNRYVKKLYTDYRKNPKTITSKTNVYIFAEMGFAPTKENFAVPFVNPVSDTITQFSLARINPTPISIASIEIVDSTSNVIGKLESLTNLDLLALKQYDKDLPENITKATLRIMAQSLRDKALLDEAKDSESLYVYKIGLSLLNMATSNADVRAWTLAPKTISFFCGTIGESTITLRTKDASGMIIDRRKISIAPEKLTVVFLRYCKNKTFAYQQSFGTSSSLGELRVIWKTVNIRSGPSTQFDICEQAVYNDRLKPIRKIENWYYVELPNGRKGYIFKKAVAPVHW